MTQNMHLLLIRIIPTSKEIYGNSYNIISADYGMVYLNLFFLDIKYFTWKNDYFGLLFLRHSDGNPCRMGVWAIDSFVTMERDTYIIFLFYKIKFYKK